MKTHVGPGVGSEVERIFRAKKSVRVCSPWITPELCRRLAGLVDSGVEVWIMTSNDAGNAGSLQVLLNAGTPKRSFWRKIFGLDKRSRPNLHTLIVREKSTYGSHAGTGIRSLFARDHFLHAKIYSCDGVFAAIGSPNLTHSGLRSNIECLVTFESREEVGQVESDFDKLWRHYSSYGSSVIEEKDLGGKTAAHGY